MLTKLKIWWLLRNLHCGNTEKREAAAKKLGKMGGNQAIMPLISALGDVVSVRNAVADALVNIGEPSWAQWATCKPPDFLLRLASSGDKRAIYPLIYALGFFHNGLMMQRASVALAMLGDKRAVAPLCKALQKGCDCRGRRAAAAALGELGDNQAVESLIQALDDEVSVGAEAANALIKMGVGEKDADSHERKRKKIGAERDMDRLVRSICIVDRESLMIGMSKIMELWKTRFVLLRDEGEIETARKYFNDVIMKQGYTLGLTASDKDFFESSARLFLLNHEVIHVVSYLGIGNTNPEVTATQLLTKLDSFITDNPSFDNKKEGLFLKAQVLKALFEMAHVDQLTALKNTTRTTLNEVLNSTEIKGTQLALSILKDQEMILKQGSEYRWSDLDTLVTDMSGT